MKVNRDLLLSAFITLCIHAAVLVGTNAITTTPVEYSVQKAPSSVEVTLVKKEKKKEVKKQKPKVEKKVEVKEPKKPKEKKKEKPEKKVEKKVAKKKIPKKEVVKSPGPVEEKKDKEVKEEMTEPERVSEPVNEEKIEKEIEELVQKIEKPKEKEPEPEVSEKSGTPVQMPAYLNNKPPQYPSMARKRGFEGKVILRVRVLSSGNPQELEIKDSSGYDILDEAAMKAVEKWKFKPATRGGNPVDSWVEIPIRFELRDT